MKCLISNDFLPNSYGLVVSNKKICFLLIFQKRKLYISITKPCRYELEAVTFNQERYYILPSHSTALT